MIVLVTHSRTLDSSEFSTGRRRTAARVMAQRARVAKEIGDKEFGERTTRVISEDKELLEKLAKV